MTKLVKDCFGFQGSTAIEQPGKCIDCELFVKCHMISTTQSLTTIENILECLADHILPDDSDSA